MANINIDGKEYDFDTLSMEAKSHVVAIQFCEAELQRLQMGITTTQTSLAAYKTALKAALEAKGRG